MTEKAEFRFCGEVRLSSKSLRCAAIEGDILAVGAFSLEVFLLSLGGDAPVVERRFDFLDSPPYSLALAAPSLFLGLQSGDVLQLNLEGEPLGQRAAHAGVVSSLALHAGRVASGGWDGVCVVAEAATGAELFRRTVGEFAVCVQFAVSGALLVGLRSGEVLLLAAENYAQLRSVKAHSDIIRDIQPFGDAFITVSNDGGVRTWSADLKPLSALENLHSTFIFSACAARLPNGRGVILSAGEGRSLRASDERALLAAIAVPATQWRICWDARRGRALSLGEDGVCRAFALEPPGDDALHAEYVRAAAVVGGFSAEESQKLAPVARMAEFAGKREGEVRVFRNGDRGEAYCWKDGKWELIGEVLGGPPRSAYGGDAHFAAGEYDFLFEIQNENGKGATLPFNRGECAVAAAEKFLARERMSAAYKSQIVEFLRKNAKAESVEAKVESVSPRFALFPIFEPIYFESQNVEMLIKHIEASNGELDASKALTFAELQTLRRLTEKLIDESAPSLSDAELALFDRKLLRWNASAALPVLDLIRLFALHADSRRLLDSADAGLRFTVFAVASTAGDARRETLAFRLAANYARHSPLAAVRAAPLLAELAALRGRALSQSATRALLAFVNNLSCYAANGGERADFGALLRALAATDLEFVRCVGEAPSLLVPIGNVLSLRVGEFDRAVAETFSEFLRSLPSDEIGFLREILNFLNSV